MAPRVRLSMNRLINGIGFYLNSFDEGSGGREERLIERERETNATRQRDGWSESGEDGQETRCVGATALSPAGAQASLFTSQTLEK